MIGFNIGDTVIIKKDPNKISTIVDFKEEETGDVIYEVEREGQFRSNDLLLVPAMIHDLDPDVEFMRTVMVTGGAGYIGSVLVRTLLEEGYKVVCVDNLRYGGEALLGLWGNPGFSFIKADLTDFDQVDSILAAIRCFAIVHLAAIVGDPACALEPELARRTNLVAPRYLVERALETGVSRFIFASTCSNYGRMANSNGWVDEGSPLAPISLYAEFKVALEDLLLNGIEKRETFSPTALRFATVYGVSPRMRFDLTINEFTKEFALDRELVVFGEQFWRPYCHVSDVSRAITLVLKAPRDKVAYNVFNVGDSSENYTKKMLVSELLKQMPRGRVRYVHKEEDPRDYRVRFDKIRSELGFKISKTVPEGMKEVLEVLGLGILENPDNWRYCNT